MKIYIGIENGIIGAVYCTEEAKVTVVDFDKHGDPTLIINNFEAEKTLESDIDNFISEAQQEIDDCN